ncbi:molybdenum cofactor biosynthesis protein A [Planctopirus limnophila DSM 3776]|uniref:GTP 3',8-cyclase n=1 Tax=Planctopirus limnophila (strain ATCC 43296 / DSM 3776 / IFAM 1008 / Mu 290) TaxID=521674 RepID=D5SU78_PLAL2|nr:GTP 3',8-cyclase MoaA [Planctopirus limnophila]ADG69131.1 molybdenum cofactor biosynthesis protein A [Planctopirus limnophila DSM 3776]
MTLVDSFGRTHNNLRISVTDRCNIRCFYCMPEGPVQYLPRQHLLTYEEITELVKIFVSLGIDRVRLTGGEPLVRQDLPVLIKSLKAIDGLVDIGLTTNGILLADQAQALKEAGLSRINISLDALDEASFREFARRDGLEAVLRGIEAAQRVGLDPIKINAVAVRGLTEKQIIPFGEFALKTGIDVRFIEYMPLDAENQWEREKVLFASEIRQALIEHFGPLTAESTGSREAPATDYTFASGKGQIGFIASVSEPFCNRCNRLRLTADGKLRNCLFSLEETDLKSLLRLEESVDHRQRLIVEAIRESVAHKKEGHEINTARFIQPARPMHSIGG